MIPARNWSRPTRNPVWILALAAVFLVSGCAGQTPHTTVVKVGPPLTAVINLVADVCEKGTLDQARCQKASIAADGAEIAWNTARATIRDNESLGLKEYGKVLNALFQIAALLREAGVELPLPTQGFIGEVIGRLD